MYDELINTENKLYTPSSLSSIDNDFINIKFQQGNQFQEIEISGNENISRISDFIKDSFQFYVIKDLYKNGFKNLYKKSNTLKLYNNLIQGQIEDEEYDKEIESNPDKYIIRIDKEVNDDIIHGIKQISEETEIEFDLNEAEEIFSVKLRDYLEK